MRIQVLLLFFMGPFIKDQWITHLKILQYVKESKQEKTWELYESMKFFFPWVDGILDCLSETSDPQQHHIRETDLKALSNHDSEDAEAETSYSASCSDDDQPAASKKDRTYAFNLGTQQKSLILEVEKNPILYQKAIGADRDLKTKTWQKVAKTLHGRKYVKKNPESGNQNLK